jgi:hypothetical protein
LQVDTIVNLVELYPAYSLLICGGLLLLAFFLLLLLFIKVSRLNKKYVKLAAAENDNQGTGVPGEDLGLADYNRNLERLEKKFSTALQHVAMVRFDAFERVGNGLSFALAVLDDRGDGFVVSSLFGGENTRTYAKVIVDGKPSHPLSPEEKEAIAKAMDF